MANCNDVINLVRSRVGTTFPDAVVGQCVAMITGVSRELHIGFDTYCRGVGGAKDLWNNSVPSGWHKVPGDPANDAHAAQIWNSLPNGAIVIFTNSGYGHVAVKNGPWGSPGDTIQQNWNTDGGGGPVTTGNCGGWCQGGGAGFLGAWVSDDNSGSTTQNNNPAQNENNANQTGKQISDLASEFNNKIKKLIEEAIKNIEKKSNTILPSQSFNNLTYSNHFYTIQKALREYTAHINHDALLKLFKGILDALNTPEKPANSGNNNPQPSGSSDIGSVQDRVIYMIKKSRAEEPQANPFGVCGIIGNFVHEGGPNMDGNIFEAMTYCTIKNPAGHNPTCEDLFDGWGPFARLYGISLNESAYLVNGQHYLGVGLGQWTGVRCYNLFKKYGNVEMWKFKNQLDFMFSGEEGANANIARACLRNSESAGEGAYNFYKYWERASTSTLAQRQATAQEWLPFVQQHWNDK